MLMKACSAVIVAVGEQKRANACFAIDYMLNNTNISRSWLHGAHEHILPKDVSVKDKDVIVQGEH